MYPASAGKRDPHARFWEQVQEIRNRLGVDLDVWPLTAAPGNAAEPRCVTESGMVLLNDNDVDEAWIRENAGGQVIEQPVRTSTLGLSTHKTTCGQKDLPNLIRHLNERYRQTRQGARNAWGLNHVVSIASGVNKCPADEPRPVQSETPIWPPPRERGGAGVRVLVIDTGIVLGHPDGPSTDLNAPFAGVPYDDESVYNDETVADPPVEERQTWRPIGGTSVTKLYGGHGLFIAGVLKAAVPDAIIRVSNLLQSAGAMFECDFGDRVLEKMASFKPHIVSLSAGGTTLDGQKMFFVDPFLKRLATEYCDVVLVAAAGNDGSSSEFWPAAAARGNKQVVSVGALRRTTEGLACFSNYGPWVTVYAHGEGHINAFPDGLYAYRHAASDTCRYRDHYRPCSCITDKAYGDVVLMQRRAQWSGTSFATPLVAGMIARYMASRQQPADFNAVAAAEALIEECGQEYIDPFEGLPMRVLL